MLGEFSRLVNTTTIKIYNVANVTFLCGGIVADPSRPPKSFRDVFYRTIEANSGFEFILIERLDEYDYAKKYHNLLDFERDISELASLIVIFLEGPGSIAELGSFAVIENISSKLLVLIHSTHYGNRSFIHRGPIEYLRRNKGDASVAVLNGIHLKSSGIEDFDKVDADILSSAVFSALRRRNKEIPKYASFDAALREHNLKMIAGIVSVYGCLSLNEIHAEANKVFGLEKEATERAVACLQISGWVKLVPLSDGEYYVYRFKQRPIGYKLCENSGYKSRVTFEVAIREYWQEFHNERFAVISDAMKGAI